MSFEHAIFHFSFGNTLIRRDLYKPKEEIEIIFETHLKQLYLSCGFYCVPELMLQLLMQELISEKPPIHVPCPPFYLSPLFLFSYSACQAYGKMHLLTISKERLFVIIKDSK